MGISVNVRALMCRKLCYMLLVDNPDIALCPASLNDEYITNINVL